MFFRTISRFSGSALVLSLALAGCKTDDMGFSVSDCPEALSPGCGVFCANGHAHANMACGSNLEGDLQVRNLASKDNNICAQGISSTDGVEHSAHELKGYVPICASPNQSEDDLDVELEPEADSNN